MSMTVGNLKFSGDMEHLRLLMEELGGDLDTKAEVLKHVEKDELRTACSDIRLPGDKKLKPIQKAELVKLWDDLQRTAQAVTPTAPLPVADAPAAKAPPGDKPDHTDKVRLSSCLDQVAEDSCPLLPPSEVSWLRDQYELICGAHRKKMSGQRQNS